MFPTSNDINNDHTDLEMFFRNLPRLAAEARRLQHSTNINVLELMHRRLENATMVINTIMQRHCEMQPRDCDEISLQQQMRFLQHQIWTLFEHFHNLCFEQTNTYNTSFNSPIVRRSGPGRPSYDVGVGMVSDLFRIHRSWTMVSAELGISTRTLLRRRSEFGMNISSSTGQRVTYTNITEEDLCNAIAGVLQTLPDVGESYVIGKL
jgi:hypothetical protein